MKQIEVEFKTNANGTGMQFFRQIKKGFTPKGKAVYIYERIHAIGDKEGETFGFEVIAPSIKKAGTYSLPGGKSITYAEDFEEYPGASKFGISAWSYPAYQDGGARWKFEQLTKELIEIEEIEETNNMIENDNVDTNEVPSNVTKSRGRPKNDRPLLSIPSGEFSTTELCKLNNTDYSVAAVFLRDCEAAGTVKRTRTERRNAKGKETQLFQVV